MDERINGWIDERWMGGWQDGWMVEQTVEWKDEGNNG